MTGRLTEIARLEIDEVNRAAGSRGHGSRAHDGRHRRAFMRDRYGNQEIACLSIGMAAADREDAAADRDRARRRGTTIAPGDGGRVVVADGTVRVGRVGFGPTRIGERRHRLIAEGRPWDRREVDPRRPYPR